MVKKCRYFRGIAKLLLPGTSTIGYCITCYLYVDVGNLSCLISKLKLAGLHAIIKSLSVTENSCWLTKEPFTNNNLCKVFFFFFLLLVFFFFFNVHTAQTLALSLFVDMHVFCFHSKNLSFPYLASLVAVPDSWEQWPKQTWVYL